MKHIFFFIAGRLRGCGGVRMSFMNLPVTVLTFFVRISHVIHVPCTVACIGAPYARSIEK